MRTSKFEQEPYVNRGPRGGAFPRSADSSIRSKMSHAKSVGLDHVQQDIELAVWLWTMPDHAKIIILETTFTK